MYLPHQPLAHVIFPCLDCHLQPYGNEKNIIQKWKKEKKKDMPTLCVLIKTLEIILGLSPKREAQVRALPALPPP